MAELNKHMFGKLKGTFGSAVFRQRNGKNYISQKPSSYNPPNDENYFARINKFKLATKIASTVNANNMLKNIWEYKKPKSSNLYNHLVSLTYPNIVNNSVSTTFQFTPDSELKITVSSAEINNEQLILKLSPINSSFVDISNEKKCSITALLCFTSNSDSSFDVINLNSNYVNLDLENPMQFIFNLSSSTLGKMNSDYSKYIFSSLLTFDESNSLINYSSTSYYMIQ